MAAASHATSATVAGIGVGVDLASIGELVHVAAWRAAA